MSRISPARVPFEDPNLLGILDLFEDDEAAPEPDEEPQGRDFALEGRQEAMVEAWLLAHPWSTVPQIREGIERDTGHYIERIQRALDDIGRRRLIRDRRTKDGTRRKEYQITDLPPEPRAVAAAWVYEWPDGRITVEASPTCQEPGTARALAARLRVLVGRGAP